jgi:putative nucleotidyltransferase with HDIG domain
LRISLKIKINLLILLGLLFLSVVSFIAIQKLLQKEYKEFAQKKIHNGFEYFSSEMQKSENRLIDIVLNISNHTDIISSVNMVSNYQNIDQYQPIIFDEEKKSIINNLYEHLKIEEISFLGIYDKYGEPLVIFDKKRDDYYIISYKNSKTIAKSMENGWHKSDLISKDKLTQIKFSNYLNIGYKLYEDLEIGFDIVATRPIKKVYRDGTSQIVGYIKAVQTNTPEFLDRIVNSKDMEFYIFSDAHLESLGLSPKDLGSIELKDSSLEDIDKFWVENDKYFLHSHHINSLNNKRINFIFAYSKDAYTEKISSILFTLMIIFIIVSTCSMIFLSLLIKKNLSEPLDQLLSGIEYIKSGKFKDGIKIETKDELSNLADSFNEMSKTINSRENELVKNYEETLLTFVDLIEQRDSYTKGHTTRVATYCKMIATEMGYSKDDVDKIYKAGILHDMGKITTPDSILLKPGKLSNLEYKIMKEHVNDGCTILRQINPYKELVEIIEQHHERYDGKGYPKGLKNDQIHPLARIMIVADAFDAMTTSRIYKPRMCLSDAVDELQKCMGSQFDPDVVSVAAKVLKNIDINEMIDQSPKTIIEEQRMSYFYKDQLTTLYNRDYLESILSDNLISKDDYKYSKILYLRGLSNYNNIMSWKDGDILLINFANYLHKIAGDSLIFRINGDNFLVLSKERKLNITKDLVNLESPTKDTSVNVDIESYNSREDIKNKFNIR